MYLRGFVPEGHIGKVKVGQPARVYLDSNPTQPIDALFRASIPQATFTPENTYFRDDRVKQVVGVKLQLKGAVGFAKPGMPADGEILVSRRAPGRTAAEVMTQTIVAPAVVDEVEAPIAIRVANLDEALRRPRSGARHQRSTSARARSSGSSGPTAPAKHRRSRFWPA